MCPSHYGVADISLLASTFACKRFEDLFQEAFAAPWFAVNLLNSFGALFQNTVFVTCLQKYQRSFSC